MEEIEALGAALVAICPQRPEFLKQMVEKHNLSFAILRDEGNAYAGALGLRYELPDYLREAYRSLSIDLPRLNGEPSWTLAVPARLVVDRGGIVRGADYDADYRYRPEPDKTVADLKKLR